MSAEKRVRSRPSARMLGTLTVAALMAVITPAVATARGGPHLDDGEPLLRQVALDNVRYHSITAAERDGYSGDIVPMCMDDSVAGGMGVHWINLELLTDGEITPLEPEALVYELGPRGSKRLVAVEWVMPPNEEYPAPGDGGTGPMLFGQDFTWQSVLGVWKLHAWIYQPNPSGLFADFNPTVNLCPTM